jgi:hypothetical protein
VPEAFCYLLSISALLPPLLLGRSPCPPWAPAYSARPPTAPPRLVLGTTTSAGDLPCWGRGLRASFRSNFAYSWAQWAPETGWRWSRGSDVQLGATWYLVRGGGGGRGRGRARPAPAPAPSSFASSPCKWLAPGKAVRLFSVRLIAHR